jgi:hypothetical protein
MAGAQRRAARSPKRRDVLIGYDCVNLDLNQPFWVYETVNRHDRVDWSSLKTVKLPCLDCLLPVLYVGQDYPRPDYVVQTGTSLLQRSLDDLKALLCLDEDVADTDCLAIRVYGRSSTNRNEIADSNRSAEADYFLHRITV